MDWKQWNDIISASCEWLGVLWAVCELLTCRQRRFTSKPAASKQNIRQWTWVYLFPPAAFSKYSLHPGLLRCYGYRYMYCCHIFRDSPKFYGWHHCKLYVSLKCMHFICIEISINPWISTLLIIHSYDSREEFQVKKKLQKHHCKFYQNMCTW